MLDPMKEDKQWNPQNNAMDQNCFVLLVFYVFSGQKFPGQLTFRPHHSNSSGAIWTFRPQSAS